MILMKTRCPCHQCRHFSYDDVRKWPKGRCVKREELVDGLKTLMLRPRPVSRKRECMDYDAHGLDDGEFPLTMEEYSMKHFEWGED